VGGLQTEVELKSLTVSNCCRSSSINCIGENEGRPRLFLNTLHIQNELDDVRSPRSAGCTKVLRRGSPADETTESTADPSGARTSDSVTVSSCKSGYVDSFLLSKSPSHSNERKYMRIRYGDSPQVGNNLDWQLGKGHEVKNQPTR